MQLTVWTYEGPPHVGAMRVATAMKGVHYVLHAPQGDTYADLLFTMIERRQGRPPVTYTTFQARDLGSDTADLFERAIRDAEARFTPDALLVGASCTAELLQDDPSGIGRALKLATPVVPLELPSYQRKESWGASETFYRIVRRFAVAPSSPPDDPRPSVNLLGPTALGFRHRDDVIEIGRLLESMGVRVNVVAPLGATVGDIARLPEASFNLVLYRETGEAAARYLEKAFGQRWISPIPMGVGGTRDMLEAVAELTGLELPELPPDLHSRLPWYSRSIDSTYLTGKRVFVFGDATHALGAARVAKEELGFEVVGLGTYQREHARDVRAAAKDLGLEALITDDHLAVEERIHELQPELVLGTQMERHVAKRLGVPCAVISAPVHVQDFPARYAPQFGFEGANVLFDTLVHPLMMGLEEHLLGMFREDFEFADGAGPSHLGHGSRRSPPSTDDPAPASEAPAASTETAPTAHESPTPSASPSSDELRWEAEAEKELRKIPFFVRGKARRNTERFARERGLISITLETLYDAKAHFGR